MNKRKKQLKFWRKLHRWAGLSLAIGVIWLAVTGILLNHSNDIALDATTVKQAWLLDWMAVPEPKDTNIYLHQGFQQSDDVSVNNKELAHKNSPPSSEPFVADIAVVEMAQALYIYDLNQQKILRQLSSGATEASNLINVLYLPEMMAVVGKQNAWLLSYEGQIIEQLSDWPPQPLIHLNNAYLLQNGEVGLQGSNASGDSLVLLSEDGLFTWKTLRRLADNSATERFTTDRAGQANMLNAKSELYKTINEKAKRFYRNQQLTWEQALLKMHNGDIFGSLGKWLLDLVAIGLLLMCVSGIWLWQRLRAKKSR